MTWGLTTSPGPRTVNTDGTSFQTLITFTEENANPDDLTLSGSTLYGTTHLGGSSGSGTLFACSLDWLRSPAFSADLPEPPAWFMLIACVAALVGVRPFHRIGFLSVTRL